MRWTLSKTSTITLYLAAVSHVLNKREAHSHRCGLLTYWTDYEVFSLMAEPVASPWMLWPGHNSVSTCVRAYAIWSSSTYFRSLAILSSWFRYLGCKQRFVCAREYLHLSLRRGLVSSLFINTMGGKATTNVIWGTCPVLSDALMMSWYNHMSRMIIPGSWCRGWLCIKQSWGGIWAETTPLIVECASAGMRVHDSWQAWSNVYDLV